MRVVDFYEVAEDAPVVSLPLFICNVPAGFPSPADDYIDLSLDLNQYLVKKPANTFMIKVEGDSMATTIQSGDILTVDRTLTASENCIVLAVVNAEFTIKRIRYQDDKVFLYPDNPRYSPIAITEFDQFEIWGVVTGLARRFS